LLLAAVGSIALAMQFYRHTLRPLTGRQRLIFVALRCGFILSLLLCLAGPARVERVYDGNQDARPLAVVVDRSASMNVADSQGTTRLSHAVRVWKKVEPSAIHSFPSINYFHFSTSLETAPDLEGAMTATESGTETHLYDSLDKALADSPAGGYGGVVCLTDGLDTTDSTTENLSARAVQNHSPLYFAVGQNQQTAREMLLVREMSVPGRALRKSRFTTTVLIEAHTTKERDVPVTFLVENQPIAQTAIHLHAGNNLIPWTVPVDAAEPGLLHLEARIGDGAEQETTDAIVPVVATDKIPVLFYQGTLDWSFRFIATALQGDTSFVLTGLFNPSLNLTQLTAPGDQPAISELPNTVEALQPYQIVVLSNVFGNELTAAQQKALLDYVHGGGGLLFLVSDTNMARSFAGTPLESVLPVIFEAPPKQPSHDDSVQQFQDMMRSLGGVNQSQEDAFAANSQADSGSEPLQNFAVPPGAKGSKLSGLLAGNPDATMQNMPQFSSYARVHGVKAGSQVLAIHPQDKTDSNESRALLVTQRFGQGQVTTLLTDALWRWRLSLPSTSHDPEIFWQQLFLALARHRAGSDGLRFALQPFYASLGQTSAFRLDGVQGTGPTLTAVSPSGQTQVLTSQPGPQTGSWLFQLTTGEAGKWRIKAQDNSGAYMETLVRVSNASHKDELSGLPPDTEGLRKLAESTGGSLLNDGTPEDWSPSRIHQQATLLSKHAHPLWNNWALLLIALGFYVTELIWRRRAKLL
jgi:uncharacterized membrane protein